MIAGFLKMHRPKQSWVLALSIALLAILVLFFQVAEVKADDQRRESNLQLKCLKVQNRLNLETTRRL